MGEQPERDTAQFPPGTMLDEKYRIDRLLAVGGMGAVYIGEHTKLKKKVAVKVLRTELANAEGAVERFQREAIAASQIGHDNIVEVTDLGNTEGGVAFLVMEYLDGLNLSETIKKSGPLPVPRACDIAVEVLSAIDAAHATGIVHRDLKPENVFLAQKSRGETVKILDFGISRMRVGEDDDGRLTQTGTVMGTPYYMSPEQARGDRSIGPASDIYSAGVILYEMLTGTLPYEADTFNMVMFRVISGEWVKPRQRRADLPSALERIICKAMALEPDQRYASAAELARELEPFAEQARITRPSTPPPARTASEGMSTAETLAHESGVGTADTVAHDTGQADISAPGATVPQTRRKASPVFGIIALVAAGVGAALFAFGRGDDTRTESETREAAALPPATEGRDTEAADPPAAPAPVEVRFVVTPDDAAITVDGQPLDEPLAVREPTDRASKVVIAREGYVTKELEVAFDVNQRIELTLDPVRKPLNARRKRVKRDKKKPDDDGDDKKNKRIIVDSPYD